MLLSFTGAKKRRKKRLHTQLWIWLQRPAITQRMCCDCQLFKFDMMTQPFVICNIRICPLLNISNKPTRYIHLTVLFPSKLSKDLTGKAISCFHYLSFSWCWNWTPKQSGYVWTPCLCGSNVCPPRWRSAALKHQNTRQCLHRFVSGCFTSFKKKKKKKAT